MRIISGRFKGQQLVSFKADHIRPTTDRVKESQFNILMNNFEGCTVLDLFCGTGSLGLEALSRGAEHVVFVDQNDKSIEITKKNIEKLKIQSANYKIYKQDVYSFFKKYKGPAFDIIFIDPPFTEKMAHAVMQKLSEVQIFSVETVITIESGKKEKVEDLYGDLVRFDAREFGDKTLSFFRKKAVD